MNETAQTDRTPWPPAVQEVGAPITKDHLDALERMEDLNRDREFGAVVEQVISTWKLQQDSERKLREEYAKVVLAGLAVETIVAAVIMVLLGAKVLSFESWVANVFFGAVFGQVSIAALGITKYLFPSSQTQLSPLDVLSLRYAGGKSRTSNRIER